MVVYFVPFSFLFYCDCVGRGVGLINIVMHSRVSSESS